LGEKSPLIFTDMNNKNSDATALNPPQCMQHSYTCGYQSHVICITEWSGL